MAYRTHIGIPTITPAISLSASIIFITVATATNDHVFIHVIIITDRTKAGLATIDTG
jgi:hypothetical protein